jgi:hypothetical protein
MRIEKNQIEKLVKEWFAKSAGSEWRRLQRNPYHQSEFIVTIHFLEKYLPRDFLLIMKKKRINFTRIRKSENADENFAKNLHSPISSWKR